MEESFEQWLLSLVPTCPHRKRLSKNILSKRESKGFPQRWLLSFIEAGIALAGTLTWLPCFSQEIEPSYETLVALVIKHLEIALGAVNGSEDKL